MKHLLGRLRASRAPRSPLDPLTRIAIKHGTDKFGAHLYTPEYERLFRPLRDKPIKLLEIGVGGYHSPLGGGLSLATWAEYFPHAAIVGLDIEEKRLDLDPRITIVRGSQTDPDVLDEVSRLHGPFDIIIDDGSHLPQDVLTTFRKLYPAMTETGFYVIEDTQTSVWPDFQGRPDGRSTIFELAYEVGLAVQANEVVVGGQSPTYLEFGTITRSVQVLRNQIVFERGRNTYPSNNKLDPDDPGVSAIRAAIEHERQQHPSPGAFMTCIDMDVCGARNGHAIALAKEAMTRYPDHVGLLAFVHDLFARNQCDADRQQAARALAKACPDDRWVQGLLR